MSKTYLKACPLCQYSILNFHQSLSPVPGAGLWSPGRLVEAPPRVLQPCTAGSWELQLGIILHVKGLLPPALSDLGTGGVSKTDEFSKSTKGWGSFSIQKFMLQIRDLWIGQHDFPKMRGEGRASKAVWNFSENTSVLETPFVPDKGTGWSLIRPCPFSVPKGKST